MTGAAGRPWWQTTNTPTRGFLRGGVFLTLATISWVIAVVDGEISLIRAVLGVALTVLGLMHVASAVATLARGTRGTEDDPPD